MSYDFDAALKNYADVLVRVGTNVEPGKKLIFNAPVTDDPTVLKLCRYIVASAYDAGARHVIVNWNDEQEFKIRLEHAPDDSFTEANEWDAKALHEVIEEGGSALSLRVADPTLLEGQDAEKIATYRTTAAALRQPTRKLWNQGIGTWSLASASFQPWANTVLPNVPEDERVAKLWEMIFQVTRMFEDDPVAAWQAHSQALIARARALTAKQYSALKFIAPGTDLTLGLADNHIWLGGGDHTQAGRPYMPNIPTEEVFTMPHRARVDGTLSATMPLVYSGTVIDDFSLTFKDGKVVDLRAKKGEATLRKIIETDEGASRLGEIALVPHSSPISQLGTLFYNTLFDENASCHVALGAAYHNTMENGPFMSESDYAAAGGNSSLVHTDFMVGSGDMQIDGIKADGSSEPVMRDGEWAFEI
ncbi:MAG: aminopeptidase [Anaerolineaceae bacterium]|nr:aminopeptidase [Anaerolineaceae bacterium]